MGAKCCAGAGVLRAGVLLSRESPPSGYLLTACRATGPVAGSQA
jgi:hypothetical protein